jgi:hypothetical protein
MVKEIHEEVQKNASKVHDAACSRASLFALRCLGAGDGGAAYDRAVDLYTATQRAWFSDLKITVQPTFFTEWISWSIEMRRLRGSSKSAATAESSAVSDA